MLRRTALVLVVTSTMAAGCTGSDDTPDITQFDPPDLTAQLALEAPEIALTVLAPAGALTPAEAAVFQRDTGCVVSTTEWVDPAEIPTRLEAGGTDVVLAPGDVALGLIGSGAVAPMNPDLVPAYGGVAEGLKLKRWNSFGGAPYGVPQGRQITQVVVAASTPPPSSLAEVFNGLGTAVVADSASVIADAALALSTAEPDLEITDPAALDDDQLAAVVELLTAADLLEAPGPAVATTLTGGSAAGRLYALTDPATTVPPPAAVVPAAPISGGSSTWMLAADAEHPNCAYRFLQHVLSPLVQSAWAVRAQAAPAAPGVCSQIADATLCERTHAADETFWSSVQMRVTPLEDCLDGRTDVACTDADDWAAAWESVTGSTPSPSRS